MEAKDSFENQSRIENVQELKSSVQGYVENAEEPNLAGFLDEVALYTDLDSADDSDNSVVMMTMHAAKGLEFPCVFVVGMEEGIFPGMRVIGEPEEMEEERRLCYVALTRAKQRLYLTCANHRMLFGHTTSNRISRFARPPQTKTGGGRFLLPNSAGGAHRIPASCPFRRPGGRQHHWTLCVGTENAIRRGTDLRHFSTVPQGRNGAAYRLWAGHDYRRHPYGRGCPH